MTHFKQAISLNVWENKYRYQQNGVRESTVEETWVRIAKAIAQAENRQIRGKWQKAFEKILTDFQFLPGGRILAGAGTAHHVTLLNCFVMHIGEDSLRGIFDAVKEGALTLQQGGGVGYDFSVLRPAGAPAEHAGVIASGPVSFMQIWDAMCKVLLSTGTRRGAMMGVLRCDHPDIEAFIRAKQDSRALCHFNVSVMVTDDFMRAVEADDEWPLIFAGRTYRRIKARVLWEEIIRAAYDYAEPGVLFYDTINRQNNLWYCETIATTNPCGEIPLPPYDACDLGAINLTQFISSPFTSAAAIRWHDLEEVVSTATRFLDNVLDVSRYPLRVQRQQSHQTRRLGLGLTGLADALVMLGVRYGSPEAVQLSAEIMRRIAETTWQTSIDLAEEKKVFPLYSQKYLQGPFVLSLPLHLQNALKKWGVRNSHHNTIAPTGTISLLANNISNGIEPVFRATYTRRVLTAHDEAIYHVHDAAYDLWTRQYGHAELPPAWVDAETLTPDEHLNMQAAMQPYIDNAISKTINLPQDFPFEKLTDVYTKAHQIGLKGCTIYRPNAIRGYVLAANEKQAVDGAPDCGCAE